MSTIAILALGLLGQAGQNWSLAPKWTTGAEVVYRGSIVHSSVGQQGAKFEQPFELEATMLVLSVDPARNAEVGCYTVVRMPGSNPKQDKESVEGVSSVHFDFVKVTPLGQPTWGTSSAQIAQPPDGEAPWELGYLAELPGESVQIGQEFTLRRAGEPVMTGKVVGTTEVQGYPCVQIQYTQRSQNWKADRDPGLQAAARSTRDAWQSVAVIAVDPKERIVRSVHRQFTIADPDDGEAKRSITVKYELDTTFRFQGQLLQERIADFRAGYKAQTQLEQALTKIDRERKPMLRSIKSQLTAVLGQFYTTPYRPAMAEMLRMAEKIDADAETEHTVFRLSGSMRVGSKARHFSFRELESAETISSTKLKGSDVILVFVDPASELSLRALFTAMNAVQKHDQGNVRVVAACIAEEPAAIKRVREMVPGKYNVCAAKGSLRSFGVQAAPHTFVIDADGVLRADFIGYGPEMLDGIVAALDQSAPPVENTSRAKKVKETFLR